ncbi:MAG: hypothetical protein U0166_00280 [Acidobacteriota bacterium]
MPIKNTALDLTELLRLRGTHADPVLGEHLLSVNVVARFLLTLRRRLSLSGAEAERDLRSFYSDTFVSLVRHSGDPNPLPELPAETTVDACLTTMQSVIDRMHNDVVQYLKRLSFSSVPLPYAGALTAFLDFVVPFVRAIRRLGSLPKGPIYFLVDDADNLNITQTRILNSWVATRTTADLSLKISTQLAYKTFLTLSNQRISPPHDFSEVNITGVYTSHKSKFHQRMREIVGKRLGDDISPEECFPADAEQEAKVEAIADDYRARGEDSRGYSPRDDANRYSRPDYIRSLALHRGGRVNYRYAGFAQLVDISSGVVRHFLEAASRMFAEEQARHEVVRCIPPSTQDDVVREMASSFFFEELDRIEADASHEGEASDSFKKLRNLIHALGNAFHQILISEASERRVFSVALSDGGQPDILDVLRLGVRYGYFHEASIGVKVGIGRVPLFILSRRLAPFFNLDPTSFAGYQFATSDALRQAMANPTAFVRRIQGKRGMEGVFEDPQMTLPLEDE